MSSTSDRLLPCADESHGEFYPVFVFDHGTRSAAKAGFISDTGSFAIPPIFDSVDWFFDGRAAVSIDGKWGFIDTTGSVVVEPQFATHARFSEGLAVCLSDPIARQWSVIDRSGEQVFEIDYYLVGGFSEGLAWVRSRDERSAFVDRNGELVIEPRFGPVGNFKNGVAPASVAGKWGFIDISGSLIVDARYDLAISTGSGAFLGIVSDNGVIGVLDREGAFLLALQFQSFMPFREGLGWFQWADGTSALFDEAGRVQVDLGLTIGGMRCFSEGLCAASVGGDPLAADGYIDCTGSWVVQPAFKPAGMFRCGHALVQDLTGYGYIDKSGAKMWWADAGPDLPLHVCSSWITR